MGRFQAQYSLQRGSAAGSALRQCVEQDVQRLIGSVLLLSSRAAADLSGTSHWLEPSIDHQTLLGGRPNVPSRPPGHHFGTHSMIAAARSPSGPSYKARSIDQRRRPAEGEPFDADRRNAAADSALMREDRSSAAAQFFGPFGMVVGNFELDNNPFVIKPCRFKVAITKPHALETPLSPEANVGASDTNAHPGTCIYSARWDRWSAPPSATVKQ